MKSEKLLARCAGIYERSRDGQQAVIAACERLGHPDWGQCQDCECSAPYVFNSHGEKKCLICSFGAVK